MMSAKVPIVSTEPAEMLIPITEAVEVPIVPSDPTKMPVVTTEVTEVLIVATEPTGKTSVLMDRPETEGDMPWAVCFCVGISKNPRIIIAVWPLPITTGLIVGNGRFFLQRVWCNDPPTTI